MSGLLGQIVSTSLHWATWVIGLVGAGPFLLAVMVLTSVGFSLADCGRKLESRAMTGGGGIVSTVATGWSCAALVAMRPYDIFFALIFAVHVFLNTFIMVQTMVWHIRIGRLLGR